MDRRHQVFVSSTFLDLQEERAEAIQALLELNCMPAGMELFPAANEEQWNWIKRVIDESDYYVAIISGKYGSVHPDTGISYTEMEYRYALQRGKPIIALLYYDLKKLEFGKCETDPDTIKKLTEFRDLCQKKLCKFWDSKSDLGGKLSRSITQLKERHPLPGWIKTDAIPKDQELELFKLKEENRELADKLEKQAQTEPPELAQGSDPFQLDFYVQTNKRDASGHWIKHTASWRRMTITWDEIFLVMSSALLSSGLRSEAIKDLNAWANQAFDNYFTIDLSAVESELSEEDIAQIGMQLSALKYIVPQKDGDKIIWALTTSGQAKVVAVNALKKGEKRNKRDSIVPNFRDKNDS